MQRVAIINYGSGNLHSAAKAFERAARESEADAAIEVVNPHPLLAGIDTGPEGLHAYFVHSFHLVVANRDTLVAQADYGGPVTAMIGIDNIAGTQFHPEKSQTLGLRLISNFLKWRP